jgi:hypothetical protein
VGRILGPALLALVVLPAAPAWARVKKDSADDSPSQVASVWFDLLYDVIRSEGTTPPAASRIYGYASVGLYESIVPGTENHKSLVGQLAALSTLPKPKKGKDYHWGAAANAGVAQTIRGIFTSLKPENLKAINDLEEQFATQFQGESDKKEFERSVAFGKSVGDGILAWAGTDGFAEFNDCPYVPADVPGAWEPTPPGFKPPLQPCWGQLRCWVLESSADCPALGHPDFSTDSTFQFYANALEVYNVNLHLSDEQKTIALFWGDSPVATGTPPGHWIAIVGQIARNDGLSLADAAEAYVRTGIAVHDAFIQCWYTKYVTNLQRPVTFIDDNIAGGWLPLLTTPNFPTYTSGHSTQSAAVAEVLTDMFGLKPFTDTIRTDHNLGDPPGPRSFSSFDEAANEAALSRLYGGIHFSFDNNDGLHCGRCIGRTIVGKVDFKERKKGHHDDH